VDLITTKQNKLPSIIDRFPVIPLWVWDLICLLNSNFTLYNALGVGFTLHLICNWSPW
jgi:hypothetical protein